jgi:trimeric autotransporter adhesin
VSSLVIGGIILTLSGKDDVNSPTIEIASPIDSIDNDASQLLSITTIDDTEIDKIWYNWNGINVSYNSPLSITFNEGSNTINAWTNDTAGNIATTSVSFTVDTTVPTIEIVNPINGANYRYTTLLLTLDANDDVSINQTWYNINNGASNVSYTAPLSIIFNKGSNTINTWTNDTAGNIITTSVSFTVDTTVPTIEIVNPNNGANYLYSTLLLTLDANDDVSIDQTWYNINNGASNVSYTAPLSITFDEGSNTINAWTNDSAGNIVTISVEFTIKARFISGWDTNKPGILGNTNITLPLYNGGIYNFTVDWGDGSGIEHVTAWDQGVHDYGVGNDGEYTIQIDGTLQGWRFNSAGDRQKIMNITQWGNLSLGNLGNYFNGCANLNLSSISDILNLTGTTNLFGAFASCSVIEKVEHINDWDMSSVTDMSYLFLGAKIFSQNLSKWDVSSVSNMFCMFNDANAFNQDIGDWDVSSVTDMTNIFSKAYAFNQDIGDWNVSSVSTMYGMFYEAFAFNQDIGDWNVSSVSIMTNMFFNADAFNQNISSWDVSSVIDMDNMFRMANIFNQDVGDWDVSSVSTMLGMFYATTTFNQDIGDWNVSSVTSMYNMFKNVWLSPTNYESILIGWSALPLQSSVTFNAGNSQYNSGSAAETARTNIISTFSWTIIDGGAI